MSHKVVGKSTRPATARDAKKDIELNLACLDIEYSDNEKKRQNSRRKNNLVFQRGFNPLADKL